MKRTIHISILFCAAFFCAELGYGQVKSAKPQSIVLDTSDNFCYNLTEVAHRYWEDRIPNSYKKGNDTLRLFIEECGFKHYIQNYGAPWNAFDEIDGDVQGMDTANNRWLEYRGWLKKVLYLNLDTNYYCSDVNSMMTTFQYLIPEKGIDFNGHIAIIDFLLSTNRCPGIRLFLVEERNAGRKQQFEIWRDSVHDSIATPLDTSAVTIDQIGFSILRGQNGVVANKNTIHGLGDLIATKNPFSDQTTLEASIGDAMMLRLEIFDVLGRQLYSENRFFSAGDVKWNLDGKGLPKGSLYVRVSTIGGEVKTVKLIHE